MKKSKFIDNLNEKLGPFEWLYMQDGARCHTSAMAMEWLEDKVDVITDWPANSPDLNPIELLWAILKRVVAAESPNSVEELKNLLLKTWNNIKISLINKLCESFSDRLLLCLEMNGTSISRFLGMARDLKEAILETKVYRPWTQEEDELLYKLICEVGHQWVRISKLFEDRSPSSVKNRWFSHLRFKQGELLDMRMDSLLNNI